MNKVTTSMQNKKGESCINAALLKISKEIDSCKLQDTKQDFHIFEYNGTLCSGQTIQLDPPSSPLDVYVALDNSLTCIGSINSSGLFKAGNLSSLKVSNTENYSWQCSCSCMTCNQSTGVWLSDSLGNLNCATYSYYGGNNCIAFFNVCSEPVYCNECIRTCNFVEGTTIVGNTTTKTNINYCDVYEVFSPNLAGCYRFLVGGRRYEIGSSNQCVCFCNDVAVSNFTIKRSQLGNCGYFLCNYGYSNACCSILCCHPACCQVICTLNYCCVCKTTDLYGCEVCIPLAETSNDDILVSMGCTVGGTGRACSYGKVYVNGSLTDGPYSDQWFYTRYDQDKRCEGTCALIYSHLIRTSAPELKTNNFSTCNICVTICRNDDNQTCPATWWVCILGNGSTVRYKPGFRGAFSNCTYVAECKDKYLINNSLPTNGCYCICGFCYLTIDGFDVSNEIGIRYIADLNGNILCDFSNCCYGTRPNSSSTCVYCGFSCFSNYQLTTVGTSLAICKCICINTSYCDVNSCICLAGDKVSEKWDEVDVCCPNICNETTIMKHYNITNPNNQYIYYGGNYINIAKDCDSWSKLSCSISYSPSVYCNLIRKLVACQNTVGTLYSPSHHYLGCASASDEDGCFTDIYTNCYLNFSWQIARCTRIYNVTKSVIKTCNFSNCCFNFRFYYR